MAEAKPEEGEADGKLEYEIPDFVDTDDAEDYFAIKSVSYTHLDVYKRQASYWL